MHAPGKSVLLAHVLGVEIANKIGAGIRPAFQLKGWHPLAVLNTFGAAAAGGRLLDLDSFRSPATRSGSRAQRPRECVSQWER